MPVESLSSLPKRMESGGIMKGHGKPKKQICTQNRSDGLAEWISYLASIGFPVFRAMTPLLR